MQSDPKELYRLTAERTGKSEQVYKDIGTAIFAAVYAELRKPTALITRLKGVGKWYLRRNRMQSVADRIFSAEGEGTELQEIFRERLRDYEQYVKERNEAKQIRQKPSQDNPA